jgi:acetoin utilization deacetylase AcuC-like enzyme
MIESSFERVSYEGTLIILTKYQVTMAAGAIVYDSSYMNHETGDHVESKSRMDAIMKRIGADEYARRIQTAKPVEASLDAVRANHDPRYIGRVKQLAEAGGGWLDIDTYCSPRSYKVALLAVGGAITAADTVMSDEGNAFAVVRPPGHHALYDAAMGFCIFNNVACAVKHVLSNHDIRRVLIIDWDVHHGNGTQTSFFGDSRVLYASTHQRPFYPGTGDFEDVGSGDGKGFNVNLPLAPGVNDDGFFFAYDNLFIPIAKQFGPELTFISAGQDVHYADPIGGMLVTSDGFKGLTERIKSVSPRGKVVACLEGGYNPKSLADSVLAVCGSLFDFPVKTDDKALERGVSNDVRERVDRAVRIQSDYWQL